MVKWETHPDVTYYLFELRVPNNKNYAPVLASAKRTETQKEIQGLRPGTNYSVTIKGLVFSHSECSSTVYSCTVPDTAQITSGVALSSTSVLVEWTEVPSAEYYYLLITSQSTRETLNLTFTEESAEVKDLQPSTNYDCYVYSANRAGVGYESKVRTITTLVQPPVRIMVVQTGRNEAEVSWEPVDDVLMYRVSIREADQPNAESTVYNVTDTMRHLQNIQPCSEYLISVSSYNMFLVPSEPNVYSYTTNTLNPVSTVSVDYSCSTDSVVVMWMPVLGADSYKATAVTEGSTPLVCTGTETSCTINGVSCGTAYDVHVTPISENCENQVNATSAFFQTVPCAPKNLSLLTSCENEVIVFSWEKTSNTQHYKAKSVDSKGKVKQCLTEDNSCYFTHTECGNHYYFSVYAITDTCNSETSEIVDTSTAPCIPQNVQISADCNTNALVSKWDLAEGALTYTIEAYGNVGPDTYTCTSHANSCSIQGLRCGEALSVYITSHHERCSSPKTLVPEAQTAPCVPQNVAAITDCEANSITMSWDMAGNALFYMATAVDTDGSRYHCMTLDLTCTFQNLTCSTTYSVHVISSNIMCNSSMSDVLTIETVACPPSNIISTLDCANSEALISWTAEPRIESFTATALDDDNGILSCSSTTTSCVISNLKCDHHYTVTVGNHDAMCPILYSEPVHMDSVQCGPDVTVDVDCETQVMTATWEAVSNVDSYEILVSDGTTGRDFSITDPIFTSSDLECGTTYTLEVKSIIDGCISHPTLKTVTQAPCVPTNVMVREACQQSDVDVSWQESLGGVSYEVAAISNVAPQVQCNSTGTTCTLEDLMCSQTYAITMSAWNGQCYSQMTEEKQLVTEPCPPSGLVVTLNCAENSAMLIWESSANAVSYMGRAVSTTGHTVTCHVEDTGCQIEDLQCGQIYDFFVTASDNNCESADSDGVTYSTAPCPVTSVTNDVDCATNSLTTAWIAGDSPLNYTVKAEKADGTVLLCQSDESSCVFNNLPCGEQYSVTVSPVSSTCMGESSDPQVVNTAPCVPSDMNGQIQCSDNTLHMSWSLAAGAAFHLSTMTGADGVSSECRSLDGFCSFASLQCAQTYTVTVNSSNDRCNSLATLTVQSAPCDPTDVSAFLDCPSGVATVNWTASAGAEYYTVRAIAEDYVDSCGSVETSCQLQNLHCGLNYSVIVLAGDGVCNSTILTTVSIITAPCAPVMQDYSLDCGTNNAVVPWVKDEDAHSVTVTAVSDGHSVSCSSSDDNSCVLSDLQCGSTYTVTAVAQGVCPSEASVPFNIITAPCTPSGVDFTKSCGHGIAILSWEETLGRKTFYVTAKSEMDTKVCSSDTTGCSLTSMMCGQLYNISVFAIADHCNSSVPGVTQIQTAPCAPQDVDVSLVCQDNTGSVSWTASPGSVSYTVKAFRRNGGVSECTTSGTTCDIPNMQCGETYRIMVTPFSDDCQGYDSQEIDFLSGPCPPTEFTVARECNGNVAVVSWGSVPNAEFYEATAHEALTDHTHNCSSDSTTCSILDLHCGETVSVTVLTKERGCWSQPSQPFVFEAVICPPSGLTGVTTCSNNDITVSWDSSPKTGVTYYLDAMKFGGSTEQYTTQSTSHLITGLQCGELHTLQVSAQYQECTSDPSDAIETVTAPCPPTDLSATADCGTSSGTLTWTASLHATQYTATFTGDHGHETTCTTNTTQCTVALDCGHQYTASLISSTSKCDSGSAATLVFNSAPCLPGNVVATPDCAGDSFSVTWEGNAQDGPYTALAIGSDNSRLSCESPNNQCTIENLQCGLLYSIVVTTANVECGVINDSNYKVHSAPCKPAAVSLDLNCDTSEAVVRWEGTGPDQEQEVTARNVRGNSISCTSSSLNCTFSNLECGLSYDVTVVGKSGDCTSSPTNGPTLHTAPCVATDVASSYDCQSGITLVTWNAASGATLYTVEAKGNLGHTDVCQNSDTSCYFTRLACGQNYNITVQTKNSVCTSAVSETAFTTTGPCPHSNIGTNLDCGVNIATVSWTAGSGILYYDATATGLNINSIEKCSTNESSCNITTLHCGESYSVEVTGQGQTCPSPSEGFERIKSAPCPPTLLSVESSCGSDNIMVSWQTSKGAVSYMAFAENEAGQKWSCESGDTRCEITDLPCGQLFNIYVSGVDEGCIGLKSNMEVFETAPCVPQSIKTELDCPTGALNVSWDIMDRLPERIEFYIEVFGERILCIDIGCEPSARNCVVRDQKCGQSYDVKLKAVGTKCNSSLSAAQPITTAPCPLPSFNTSVDCSTGFVSVKWMNGVAGVLYSAMAVGPDGLEHSCSSSDGGCDLDALDCGTEYSVTITPSRDGCVGTRSAPQIVQTVPCVPQLSEVEIDCLTNSAWVMGTEATGAQDYVITATDNTGGIQTFECNSTLEDMCFLPPLACSKNFTFTVQARDQQCFSGHSNAFTAETGPCSPTGILSTADCENNIISISWMSVPGAVSYTATLEDLSGETSCCTSSDNNCKITDLPCGQMYILLVTAEGRTCNSSESREMARTAPCVPENLDYSFKCSNNLASIKWDHSQGGQLYQVTAVSQDNYMDKCSGHENMCDLTSLQCGQTYTVTVTAEDMDCSSKPSESVSIKTAPCTPRDFSSSVDCGSSSLSISWTDSEGADAYLATVEDSYGQMTSCQATTEGQCSVDNLGCGNIYHVSLVASDGKCDSPPTDVADTPSVPCQPQHIRAEFDCEANSALVDWYPSDGAVLYIVTATSDTGDSSTCQTDTTTHCMLEELECGESYSIQVLVVGDKCNTTSSMSGKMHTGSCVPHSISLHYSTTIGQVSWATSKGAEHYTVEAVTDQGLLSRCETSDTYCALYNVECSQTYSVTVAAFNDACPNGIPSNETAQFTTEPCPPQNLQASIQPQTNTATVTWEPSFGAVSYQVTLSGRNVQTLQCNTEETFCRREGLECGVIYHIHAIATGEIMNSAESDSISLEAGPCPVEDVTVEVDCYNNSALIVWAPALGATSYKMIARATEGHLVSCDTSGTSDTECELEGLECGQTYSITSVSMNDQTSVEMDTWVTFSTRPCQPLNVGVNLQCGTATATLFWEDVEGVEMYNATAVSSSGVTTYCSTPSPPCQFSNLDCGETYEFYVEALNDTCSSDRSDTRTVQTEPCQPSGLEVQGSCYNDTVELSWFDARGALHYIVDIFGDLGYVTSLRTADTMIEADLPCGQLYTFSVQAQDDRCSSAFSHTVEHQNGPCVPRHVESYTTCEDSLGAASWGPADGAEYYIALAVGQDGSSSVCTTVNTTCIWDDLHCGEFYTISVTAVNSECESEDSNSTTIRMASCIPQNLVSTFNCSLKVGHLSWDSVDTADFYIATAESNSGHKIQLSTNDTWAYFSEFSCGEDYFLSVQSVDEHCTSTHSQTSKLQSEPCPPTDISSSMTCVANIAVISWNNSGGADYYTATVTSEKGTSHSCWSDNNQCGIPNLRCGQPYTVSVVASNEACNSNPSEESQLMSVPCVPTNVKVTMDCATNEAIVSWDASQGALMYTASAQGTDVSCETSGLSCVLRGLQCGESYSVQVVAKDDICASLPSPATFFDSVPCVPVSGSVVVDCMVNSGIVDWMFSEGAHYYVATAESENGDVYTCSSNNTHCELMNLQCGRVFSVSVQASNDHCRSPPSSALQLESVPCPPQGLMSMLDCPSNSISVQWEHSSGADKYYVEALGIEEDMAYCTSETDSCVLDGLLCGFTYNIRVSAQNDFCNMSSAVIQQHSVPCVPSHVRTDFDCENKNVQVTWETTRGALTYSSVAQGLGGFVANCSTTDTWCTFSNLACDMNYTVTVVASDDECSSHASNPEEIYTGPCEPQNVLAEMLCDSNTGVVSWEEGDGVTSYSVHGYGPDGHIVSCGTEETTCQLPDMHCGQKYDLTITANDGRCDNSQTKASLNSVPCTPTNVGADLLCHSNIVAVTWERASGAKSYLAVAVSADGTHRSECNNTETHCDLKDLNCGTDYTVTVFGRDDSCSSVESSSAPVRTAPCTPQDVVISEQCAEGSMIVSWSVNSDAQYFLMNAYSRTGADLNCNTTEQSCSFSDLSCGQEYSVIVVAFYNDCPSSPAGPMITSSAPCVPTNINANLDCVSNSAWITWSESDGASSYYVLAEAVGVTHNASCTSAESPCSVPDLKCGTLYHIEVTAQNDHCISTPTAHYELETAPCALTSINTVTQCDSSVITVQWQMSDNMPLYAATAEGHDMSQIMCNSTSDSCQLADAVCGMQYTIIVSTSSVKCSSLRSPPKKINTAPCAPQNVTAAQSCSDNGVTVSYALSPVATSYRVEATGEDFSSTCESTEAHCTLNNLPCGKDFELTVYALTENCTSPGTTISYSSGPCPPSGLTVVYDCESLSAELTWDPSTGTDQYFASAQTLDYAPLYCSSTGLSCTISGLLCGYNYSFIMEASNNVCNSSDGTAVVVGAVPCAPTDIHVQMQRMNIMDDRFWAMISWDRVSCPDVEYQVTIAGHINDNPQTQMQITSHWLERNYFETPLPTSSTYKINVYAQNQVGVSEPSYTQTGVTVPSAPQNVVYNEALEELSWDPSVLANHYSVYENAMGVKIGLCETALLTCTIPGVDPANVEVTASNTAGTSHPNGPTVTGSRRRRDLRLLAHDYKPVSPKLVNVTMSDNTMVVKWSPVIQLGIYIVSIDKSRNFPDPEVHHVSDNTFLSIDLPYSETYCVKVAFRTTSYQSHFSTPMCINNYR